MSTAGISSRSRSGPAGSEYGFTLIELTMIVFLLAIMLAFTLPKVREVALSDNLKNTMRTLTATVKELRYQAIKDSDDYYLIYSFGSKEFHTDSTHLTDEERLEAQSDPIKMPSDVSVTDISFKGGEKMTTGEVVISFNDEGYITPSVIHFRSDDGRRFTFVMRPFLGDVDIIEDYIDIEDVTL